MSNIFNRIFHLTFSQGILALSNIVMVMIASRYLSVAEYATFRQTFLPYEIVVPLLTLGIPNTIYYLVPRREDKLNLFVESLLIIAFMSILFGVFIFMGGGRFLAHQFNNSSLNYTLNWLIFYPFIQLPLQLIISLLIYEGKTKFVAIISSFSSITLCVSIVYLSMYYHNAKYLVIAKTLVPVFFVIISVVYIIKLLKKTNNMQDGLTNNSIINNMKSILVVSIPFGIATVINTISIELDKFIVSSYSSVEVFGIYVNGSMEIPFIGVLTGAISSVIMGEMSKNVHEKNFVAASNLFKEAATKTALILFPIMCFFFINAKEFMVLLYSEKYILSSIPFKIFLLLLPIRIVVFGSALIALGKGKSILIRSMFELLFNLILSIIMLQLFGIWGVATATVIVVYLWSVPYNLYEISKGFNVRIIDLFDFKKLLTILLISLLISPVIILSKYISENSLINIIISLILYSALLIIPFTKVRLVNVKEIFSSFYLGKN